MTPWKIQLSMRNDALMCEMKHLLGSAIWMLIAGRLKAHSQQRSRAAQEIHKKNCISSQARQPPSLGDILRGAILGAKLHNDSCWRWANAGLLCTLWAILRRQTFSLSDFGVQLRPVRAFLHALHSTPGIKVVEAFMDLFQHVQRTCVPRDVGEFVSELIVWLVRRRPSP